MTEGTATYERQSSGQLAEPEAVTVAKSVILDVGNLVVQVDGAQLTAAVEGIVTDDADAVVQRDAEQFRAILTEVVGHIVDARRHVDTGELFTALERAVVHLGDAVGQRDGGEAGILEHVAAGEGQRVHRRDIDVGKLRTITESGMAQARRTVGQHYLLQLVAVVEHAVGHLLDALREAELGDAVAALEGIVLYLGDALGQRQALHGVAIAEGIVADGLQTFAERDAPDHLIIHKGMVADGLQRGRQDDGCRSAGVVVEGILGDGLNAGRDVDILEKVALAEAAGADEGNSVGQRDLQQLVAVVEGLSLQARHAGGNYQRREARAVESIAANGGDGIAEADGGQTAVVSHGIVANGGGGPGQLKAAQHGHVVEHVAAHHVVLDGIAVIVVITVNRSRAVVADRPAMVLLATLNDVHRGEVEHLEQRQETVQVVDVGAVERTADGEPLDVHGIGQCLNLAA